MDPITVSATISSLIIAVEQIVVVIHKYGSRVKGAKKEINRLCSELFALKAALEHVRMNLENADDQPGSYSAFYSPLVRTDEFRSTLSTTESLIKDLTTRFEGAPGHVNAAMHCLAWPWKKDNILEEVQQLESLKSYFILATTTDNLELSRMIYLEVGCIARTLSSQQQHLDIKAQTQFRKAVIQWLAPFDPTPLYRTALAQDQAGTGQWFLGGPFTEWSSGESAAVLWLQGKPGSGKTTLLSAAIHVTQLAKNHGGSCANAYFFCSFTDLSSQDPLNLFGSLLVQLCSVHPSLWTDIDSRYREEMDEDPGSLSKLSLSEVEAMLDTICKKLPKVHFFLDALNETEESASILSTLWRLTKSNKNLQIMVSSTEDSSRATEPVSLPLFTVSMSSSLLATDIETYVEFWLGHYEGLRNLPSHLKDDIKAKLLSRADGMFRWVQCQLQSLVRQRTAFAVQAALDVVPTTLEQTYCNNLLRIAKEDRHLAKEAFLWPAFSIRPLKFTELCEAAVVNERHSSMNEDTRILRPNDLLQMCSSLVDYNPKGENIVLAHSSVREYLTSQQIRQSEACEFFIDAATAHTILTRKCVNYLCSSDLAIGYCDTPKELADRYERWPLLAYAFHSWQTHAQHLEGAEIDNLTKSILLQFFDTIDNPRGGNYGAYVQAWLPFEPFSIENTTPLHHAARFGNKTLVKMILAKQGVGKLDLRGGRGGFTPLNVACNFGFVEVAQILLAAGASVHGTNNNGDCALQSPLMQGLATVVELLLDYGADPNFRNRRGHAPLYHAIQGRDEACCAALVRAGANTTNVDGKGLDVITIPRRTHELGEEHLNGGDGKGEIKEGGLFWAVTLGRTTPSK